MTSRLTGRPRSQWGWVRRWLQVVVLLEFLVLVLAAHPVDRGTAPDPALGAFFLADPLVLVATALAARAVPIALWFALGTIVLTVLFGRVFCGWVCPLGTIHAIASRLLAPRRKPNAARDNWSGWQRAKYYLLAGFLGMALFGGHWVTAFDPLVLLYRTTTTAILPGFQWAVEEGSTAVYQADVGVGPLRARAATEPVYAYLREHVFVVQHQAFLGSGLIVALFLVTLALNRYRPRFWCRFLCPLGALLGIFAWRPLLRRKVAKEDCNACGLCGKTCHGAAAGTPGDQWKPSECLGCLNCTESCHRGSLAFTLQVPWRREPKVEPVNLGRRATLAAAVGGVATLSLLRATPQARGTVYHPLLIRPPGARSEREFLARCTGCGLCMKVCPTGGLQPTLLEAGLEGVWTPHLVPKIGYCDHQCTLCGQVCPTGAIQLLTVDDRAEIKLGLASFDPSRCMPYAYGRECMVCEEHCPVPHKAIYALEVEVQTRDGEKVTIKRPYVDPEKCIGCGQCENVCPYKDRPGIRVSSANETRHPDNQPILPAGNDYP